jgi:hypothetical protein
VIALFIAAQVAAADAGQAQRAALETYQTCVEKNAKAFRASDLSVDPASIVIYAAAYACSAQKADLVEKTKLFLRARRPDLTPGSLAKVTAMFIENADSELEKQLLAALEQK